MTLANQLRLHAADAGHLLLEVGSRDPESLFVVDGRVSLTARDGKTRNVAIGQVDELKPIAQLRPSIYDVRALGKVTYLKIDRQKLVEFAGLSESALDDISVHTLFSNRDEEDISVIGELYQDLFDNRISLPALPSVAERIQRIYRGRQTDIDAMVHILVSYPDIARKLNNVARCPVNVESSVTERIRYSIRHLGIRSTYCLIMVYAIGKLVQRMPAEHRRRIASFWQHSLSVAAISRLLAKQTRLFPPDLAMLAGLVHGVGVLAIDDRLLDNRQLELDHLEIEHAIQVLRPEISSLCLRKWKFEDDLIRVAEECGDWSRNPDGPTDLCDLVLVANYHGLLHSDLDHSLPRAGEIPAIARLGVTPRDGIETIRQSLVVKRNIKKLFA